jgi:hypothetical protein
MMTTAEQVNAFPYFAIFSELHPSRVVRILTDVASHLLHPAFLLD